MTAKAEEAKGSQPDAKEDVAKTVDSAAATQSETKKVNRRGVAAARGTQRLKFTHELAKPNGLFIGHLASVDVSNILIGEDKTGMPSFNGLEIPKIAFTFSSNEEDANKRHFQTLSFTAVESNVNTIPGGKEEWKVNAVLDWFKHILNVYVFKGEQPTDEQADALSLAFEDFDEQGEYVPVEPEDVIAAYKSLFENVQTMLNMGANDKPVYKTKDGKPIALWLKLIRYTKHKTKGWQPINNGDLSFPTFIGEGCIEKFVQNTQPSIRVDVVKESIIPMNIESKAKAPSNIAGSVPGIPGGGMGNFGGGFGGGFNDASSAAADDDIPF